jgi:hypothetical protein
MNNLKGKQFKLSLRNCFGTYQKTLHLQNHTKSVFIFRSGAWDTLLIYLVRYNFSEVYIQTIKIILVTQHTSTRCLQVHTK